MADGDSLKHKNLIWLTAYLVLHGGIIAWIFLGRPSLSLEELKSMGSLEYTEALGGFVLTLAAIFLNELPSRDFKASLVFWGGKNAMPSARFVRLAATDRRFHISQLEDRFGGGLPTSPDEQNLLWNKIYRQNEGEAAVRSGHQSFLLMRDLTWLNALLTVVGSVCVYLATGGIRPTITYLLISTVFYLGFSISARSAGNRFILSVLACEAAKSESRPRIVTDLAS